MIFKNAAALQSKAEKTFLVEKVELFINTVSALEEKFGIGPCVVDMNLAVTKLKLMGLILDDFDMLCLKKMLPINLFSNLVYSATSSVVNDDIMGQYLTRFSNTARSQEQARKKQKTAPTIVDLFCGAGGLSLGFQQVGFKTLLATDFDPLCVETYKFNHPEVPSQKVLCEDIRTIARDMKTFVDEPVDVIIGGPPCQGFSSANKHHRVIDDPRNELYKHFLKVVEMLTPKFVVMENVKGMRKVAPQVVEDYMNMRPVVENTPVSYCVSYRLLNSVDFSVAQSRERLIYIAIRSDIAQAFGISPDDLFAVIEKKNINKPTFNLSDALEGLRSLKAPHKMNVGEVDTEESEK